MSIEQMRDVLRGKYPSASWNTKVTTMPDSQVLVIYTRLLNSGKLNKLNLK